MLRLALLCCFAVGLTLADVPETVPVAEGEGVPMEAIPEAEESEDKGSQAATDGKYFLYKIRLNWFQAVEMCFQMGKRPAAFNNATEYNALVKLIRENYPDDDYKANFWTAGSDLGEQDSYVWLSTGRSVLFTKWWTGNPNHGIFKGEMERCIELRAEYQYKMNDNICSSNNYVACERDP